MIFAITVQFDNIRNSSLSLDKQNGRLVKKLEGGFINKVYLENSVVVKSFTNDALVGISSTERALNEMVALRIFGGIVAPRLISYDDMVIRQEFIEGELYEARARRGENVFEESGAILAQIHNICSSDQPLSFYYENRFKKAINLAEPLLKAEGLSPTFNVSWMTVSEFGSRYIHGDFWLGNIIGKPGERPRVIDWEFSGTGSPFEDFAIADLWIFREFPNSSPDFWRGYGKKPDQETVNFFLVLRCVEFLATTTPENYSLEEEDGFYHNKVAVLRTLLS